MRIRPATSLDHAVFVRLFPELGVDVAPWDKARFTAEMVPTTLIAEDDELSGATLFVGRFLHP